jgi:hypothetical protein
MSRPKNATRAQILESGAKIAVESLSVLRTSRERQDHERSVNASVRGCTTDVFLNAAHH